MGSNKALILAVGIIIILLLSLGATIISFQTSKQIASSTPATNIAAVPTTSTPTNKKTNAPYVITTMTHLEGDWKDDVNEILFQKHVSDMRWAMDLFDEYGAKLTFESEQPFAKANTIWGINILKEVVDRDHGVGTHGDFGAGANNKITFEQLTSNFKANKKLVDDLVGPENNQGISGGTGPQDWVLGATAAGFKYFDAVTGFGYLSMPMSARPDGWTNEYILNTTYHDPIPPNLIDRIYPIPLSDAKDLVADKNATMIIMGGDIGELSSMSEGRSTCLLDCTLDQKDVDTVIAAIKEANSIRDTSQFAKINFHIPLVLLKPENETTLRSLLSSIKKYTDDGTLTWDTQLGAYKQYINWNK